MTRANSKDTFGSHLRAVWLACAALLVVVVGLAGPAGAGTAHADLLSDAKAGIDTYLQDSEHAAALGEPTGGIVQIADGAFQPFQEGAVYYSPEHGVHGVTGAIFVKYRQEGGANNLGLPFTDELEAGQSGARFSEFNSPGGAAIYWHPDSGAVLLSEGVLRAWRASGGVDGPFGLPLTDTRNVGRASVSTFAGPKGTEIAWSSTSGTSTVPAELLTPEMTAAGDGTVVPADQSAPQEDEEVAAATTSGSSPDWPMIGAIVGGVALALLLLWLFSRWRRGRAAKAEAKPAAVKASAPTKRETAAAPAVPRKVVAPVKKPAPEVVKPEVQEAPAELDHAMVVNEAPPVSESTLIEADRLTFAGDPEESGLVVQFADGADVSVGSSGVQVAYENNAVNADGVSGEDKTIAFLQGDEEPAED